MKIVKKGFTLAEVLITLSIIGVVASLTLPSLSSGHVKQQTAVSLSKAFSILMNTNSLALVESGGTDLQTIAPVGSTLYHDTIKGALKTVPVTLTKTYKTYTGAAFSDITTTSSAFATYDGITFIEGGTISTNKDSSGLDKYNDRYYTIYVDTNGNIKGPNVLGRDLFVFYVDTKGEVIPVGGRLMNEYFNRSNQAPLWEGKCTKATVSTNDGFNCTGAIVDKNFTIDYF